MGLTTVPYAPGAFGRDVNVPAGLCNIFLCLFMVGRLMKVFGKHICWWMAFVAVLWGVPFMLAGCRHVDDDRTPPAGVWIVFATEPEWTKYGVPAALDHREFILSEGIPAGFPYTAMMQTGYGGVLLAGDINGRPAAYDLSCPVENKPDVRIRVDDERNDAYCPRCGSRYSIYSNHGLPTEGPAADSDNPYALRKYTIAAGPNGEFRVVRP